MLNFMRYSFRHVNLFQRETFVCLFVFPPHLYAYMLSLTGISGIISCFMTCSVNTANARSTRLWPVCYPTRTSSIN